MKLAHFVHVSVTDLRTLLYQSQRLVILEPINYISDITENGKIRKTILLRSLKKRGVCHNFVMIINKLDHVMIPTTINPPHNNLRLKSNTALIPT